MSSEKWKTEIWVKAHFALLNEWKSNVFSMNVSSMVIKWEVLNGKYWWWVLIVNEWKVLMVNEWKVMNASQSNGKFNGWHLESRKLLKVSKVEVLWESIDNHWKHIFFCWTRNLNGALNTKLHTVCNQHPHQPHTNSHMPGHHMLFCRRLTHSLTATTTTNWFRH